MPLLWLFVQLKVQLLKFFTSWINGICEMKGRSQLCVHCGVWRYYCICITVTIFETLNVHSCSEDIL